MLPLNNELSLFMYEAKKILNALKMEYEKYKHVQLTTDYIGMIVHYIVSYLWSFKVKVNSTEAKKSRGVPAKVMWYFAPIL